MRPFAAGRAVVPGVTVRRHLNRSNGMDVYEAWDAHRACVVVVKVPRPDRLGDERLRAALVREGRLLERLAHPCIVRAYAVRDVPGERPAVVLETVTGETLGHLFDRLTRRLGAVELAHLGLHLGGALRYLHAEGILHLDVKPSNAVAEAGRAKLLDLSLAGPPGTYPVGHGTWSNMAPEQARGEPVGPAADVFGLGTVLFEGATGEGPFDAWEDDDLPTAHRRAEPVGRLRRLPRPLGRLVDAMLDPEPGARPSMDAVLEVLSAAARG